MRNALIWIAGQPADRENVLEADCLAIAVGKRQQMALHENPYVVGEANVRLCAKPVIAGLADTVDDQCTADRVGKNVLGA